MPTTTASSRATVLNKAKALLNEKADLFWTATQQQLCVDDANRHVYQLLCEANPEHFGTSTSFTWAKDIESYDMSGASYLGAPPYLILGVEDYPSTGGIGPSNLPRSWEPMHFHERARRHAEGWRGRYWWCMRGDHMFLAPLPSQALNVTVHWIAQPTSLILAPATDYTEVLNGLAEDFADAVAYRTAWTMNAKQGGANPQVQALWQEAEARVARMGTRRDAGGPRMVSYRGRGRHVR